MVFLDSHPSELLRAFHWDYKHYVTMEFLLKYCSHIEDKASFDKYIRSLISKGLVKSNFRKTKYKITRAGKKRIKIEDPTFWQMAGTYIKKHDRVLIVILTFILALAAVLAFFL